MTDDRYEGWRALVRSTEAERDAALSELTALRGRQERLEEALRVARPWVLKAGDREVAARADVRADLALIAAALAGEADDDQEEERA